MGNDTLSNATLRASIKSILDYLAVEEGTPLRKTLDEAPEDALPRMFYEMSAALSEMTEDKSVLERLKVKLPDGRLVTYNEASEYAKQNNIQSRVPAREDEEVTPQKAPHGEKKGPDEFKNKRPKEARYVNADSPLNYRPSGMARSGRKR